MSEQTFVKPFQRKGRPQWFLQLGKEQIPLGRSSELEAIEKAVAIQRERALRGVPQRATTSQDVREVFALFLEWCQNHRENRQFSLSPTAVGREEGVERGSLCPSPPRSRHSSECRARVAREMCAIGEP
jgi:hypothetical protein